MRAPYGFSLIEVVVSVSIIGMLAVLSSAILKAAPLARHVRFENAALTVAADQLEQLRGGGYAMLPASGPFTNPGLVAIPQSIGTMSVTDYNADTKEILIAVTWQEPGFTASSTVSLTTLMTETGGLP